MTYTDRLKAENPFGVALEATYIFPLPDRAAVTAMRMECAGHVVAGVLKERSQAREDYEQAIADGQQAAIAAIAQEAMRERHLRSVIVRVTIGNHVLITRAWGESMTGVPATTAMPSTTSRLRLSPFHRLRSLRRRWLARCVSTRRNPAFGGARGLPLPRITAEQL